MKRTFELDFTELSNNKRPGYGFQALVREIGFQLGYDVKPGGTGADEGKDLIFVITDQGLYERTIHRQWLVSCKDNSQSAKSRAVRPEDLAKSGSIKDRAIDHKCTGFLLACTTYATDDTRRYLEGLEDYSFATHVWDGDTIRRILHEHEEQMMLTLIRFFPKSYASSLPLLGRLMENLLEIIEDDEGEVQFGDTQSLVYRIQDISSSTDKLADKQRLGESLLWRLDRTGDEPSILYPLLSEWVQFGTIMSEAFVHSLVTYVMSHCLSELELADDEEEPELDKKFGASLTQEGDRYFFQFLTSGDNPKKLVITIEKSDSSIELLDK